MRAQHGAKRGRTTRPVRARITRKAGIQDAAFLPLTLA
jgi:hypothetical protein